MKMNSILITFAASVLFACSSDDDNMGTVPTDIIAPVVSTTSQQIGRAHV